MRTEKEESAAVLQVREAFINQRLYVPGEKPGICVQPEDIRIVVIAVLMADKHIKRLSVACARGKRSFPPVKQKVRLRRFNEKATVKNMCNLHRSAPHEIITQSERFPTVHFHDCRAYGALLSMGAVLPDSADNHRADRLLDRCLNLKR